MINLSSKGEVKYIMFSGKAIADLSVRFCVSTETSLSTSHVPLVLLPFEEVMFPFKIFAEFFGTDAQLQYIFSMMC